VFVINTIQIREPSGGPAEPLVQTNSELDYSVLKKKKPGPGLVFGFSDWADKRPSRTTCTCLSQARSLYLSLLEVTVLPK
jgi:hypothetical protein